MTGDSPRGQGGDPPAWEVRSDLAVGEILSRARKYYNLSLSDVEAALRIRASQLLALEQGDFEKLPGRVYAIGFVRAYAEYLGLDGDRMVHLYKVQAGGGAKRPTFHMPAPASESKLPNLGVLIISFAGVVLLISTLIFFNRDNAGREIPTVTETSTGTVSFIQKTPLEYVVEESLNQLAGPEPVAELLNPDGRIVIRAKETAWLEIRDKERDILVSRIFQPGDSYLVPHEAGITMDTGNIGGLEFVVDGEVISALGARNEVRRGVVLKPDLLTGGE